jgi:hypothetical protein
LYIDIILKQSTPTTGRRVLLSKGPNQYKLVVFSVFRVLVCDLRVLSLRLLPAEQLNHRDLHPCGLSRSHHLTELKEVREVAAVEKKKLEDELAEEKRKTKESNAQFNALTIGKVEP